MPPDVLRVGVRGRLAKVSEAFTECLLVHKEALLQLTHCRKDVPSRMGLEASE